MGENMKNPVIKKLLTNFNESPEELEKDEIIKKIALQKSCRTYH